MAGRLILSTLVLLTLLLLTGQSQTPLAQPVEGSSAWLIRIQGAIGPATADHMIRGLNKAQDAGAELVVLQLDTPGGLDLAMRDMVKSILASRIPVIGYVAPGGARAASAGTYILYACHIAAMAPATNLGAATPVQIGGPSASPFEDKKPQPPPATEPEKSPPDQPESDSSTSRATAPDAMQGKTAMERKIINDAVAYIQGLAELRGRNGEWAERAVRQGASLSAEQALELGVINLIARDKKELMAQLQGLEVTVNDVRRTLDTANLDLYEHPVDWRSEFLSVITNPNVAYMLMIIGIYGLIFEFSNPGFGLPGVLGAMCLLLALYAFQVLPISYAGLGLIVLGVGLMVAEAFAPSFGVLGLGGIVAFVIGSIILMDTELPGYQIAMPLIVAFALFSLGVLVFALGMVLRARRGALVSGLQNLVGMDAVVETVRQGTPRVRLEGELWQVECDQPLQVNDRVSVTKAEGVVLEVKKLSS